MGAIGNVSLEENKIYIHIYSYICDTCIVIYGICHTYDIYIVKAHKFTLSHSTLTPYQSTLPNICKYMPFMYKHKHVQYIELYIMYLMS